MKVTKEYLKQLIRESMHDLMVHQPAPYPASINVAPLVNKSSNFVEDPDGYEGRMAKANLYKIGEYAQSLQGLIRDEENLEPWVQEKIAVAASMMDSVGHYLQYEKMRDTPVGE
jgi:hypothetical protein